jgi:hypothetical protein
LQTDRYWDFDDASDAPVFPNGPRAQPGWSLSGAGAARMPANSPRRPGVPQQDSGPFPIVRRQKGRLVKNPLDSIYGTVISGFVLTVILYFVVKALQPVAA